MHRTGTVKHVNTKCLTVLNKYKLFVNKLLITVIRYRLIESLDEQFKTGILLS